MKKFLKFHAIEIRNIRSNYFAIKNYSYKLKKLLERKFSSNTINYPNENCLNFTNNEPLKNEEIVNYFETHPDKFKEQMLRLVKEQFFFLNSSLIHGGLKGVYDYGPCGCNMKHNIITLWRQMFINNSNNTVEIDCSILTAKRVLESSGHVSNFNDYLVTDSKSGNIYRSDQVVKNYLTKLKDGIEDENERDKIENILNTINDMDIKDIERIIQMYDIKGPDSGILSKPVKFNLLFTTAEKSEKDHLYLRPETAQGIFTNFGFLARFHHQKLPFGVGQVGTVFRNEIRPQNGLLRTREIQMAEIEYFYNPKLTGHEKFYEVSDLVLNIWSADDQMNNLKSSKKTLEKGVNENLFAENQAYFLGRIYQFLIEVGMNSDKLRFRQHLPNELAHYSNDCWDAECLTSVGWVELVGCANRGNYDLMKHGKETGKTLNIKSPMDEPKVEPNIVYFVNYQEMENVHGLKNRKLICKYLKKLSQAEIANIEYNIKYNGEAVLHIDNIMFTVTEEMLKFEEKLIKVDNEVIKPHVIEPSFGIGRILQCAIEHNLSFRRNHPNRFILTLPVKIAPFKVFILPIMKKQIFDSSVNKIIKILQEANISHLVDNSNESIGRRYSRADYIGTPFVVTVDHLSIDPNLQLVTVRERNTMKQIQIKISELTDVLHNLLSNKEKWDSLMKKYPNYAEK